MKKTAALLLAVVTACFIMTAAGCGAAVSGTDDTVAASTHPADAGDIYELIVQNHDPAASTCGQYIEAWGAAIEDASGGRIQFKYYHGGSLVGADDSVNAVLSDKADICWSAASIYSGQFPISEFIQLPLSGITCARMGCDVMQDMFR
jgi:TRAP-type C4-dicarboxylate transport system substrate-binding protein